MATILLADDSDALRGLLAGALLESGHDVLTASNGQHALAHLARQRVNLIITDIYMPGLDGLELLANVRRMRQPPPVIVMSGHTGEMDMLNAARCLGAALTLRKPFAPEELTRCAQALLCRPANDAQTTLSRK